MKRFEWDENIFYGINSLAGKSDFGDTVFVFATEYMIFVMMAFFVVYFGKKIWADRKVEGKETVFFCSVPAIAFAITHAIKFLFPTERPYVMENAVKLANEFDPGSFPSGHTTLAFAMAINIYLYNRKGGKVFLAVAAVIGVGRILVGLHYPLDVLVGMVIGVSIPLVFHKIIRYYKKEKENK